MKREYTVVESADPHRLSTQVEGYLLVGWDLAGNLQVLHWMTTDREGGVTDHWWYVQAMTRESINEAIR